MGLIPLPYRILIVLGILAGIFLYGFSMGADHEAAKYAKEKIETQEKLDKAAQDATKAEEARLAAVRDRDQMASQLAAQAAADPQAGREALSAAAVARINRQ